MAEPDSPGDASKHSKGARLDGGTPPGRVPAAEGDWRSRFFLHQSASPESARSVYRSLLDPASATGAYFLPLTRRVRALNLDAGTGGMTRFLGRFCREVVTLSRSKEHLGHLRSLAEEDGLDRMVWIPVEDAGGLDLGKEEFDVAVVGDLLSWVGGDSGEGGVRELAELLRGVRRALVPNGSLLVGVPNRWAPHRLRFRGGGDGRGASALAPAEYRRLLRGQGFEAIRFLAVAPDHRFPEQLRDPWNWGTGPSGQEDPRSWREKVKTSRLFQRNFSASYAIAAGSAQADGHVLLGELLRVLAQETRMEVLRPVQLRSSVSGLLLRVSGAARDYVVRGGIFPDQRGRVSRNARGLETLAERGILSEPRGGRGIPRLHFVGEVRGHLLTLEDHLEGRPALSLMDRKNRTPILRTLTRFLVSLAEATREGTGTGRNSFVLDLDRKVSEIRSMLVDRELADRMGEFWAGLKEEVQGLALETVWTHGDFNLGNVLLARDGGGVRGVVDWDQHMEAAPPGLDVINLFLALRGLETPTPRGHRIVALCRESWTREEDALWELYFDGLGANPGPRRTLVQAGWVNSLWNGIHLSSRSLDYSLIRADVDGVLRGVMA